MQSQDNQSQTRTSLENQGVTPPAKRRVQSAWEPLKYQVYRSFWIAGLFSNMGTWMHETGAQWLMTSLEPRPEMVSAVRTAMTLPVFFLALPAGVWADRFDRRTYLLATQVILLLTASILAVLSALDCVSPTVLLMFSAAMGVAMILNQPAWQALTPDLVPPALVPAAVAVGSISFNLARSLGPAIGGLVIAYCGVWATFAVNAISFSAVIAVLLVWQPDDNYPRPVRTVFRDELRKGIFIVSQTPYLRNALTRLCLFAVPASILWSLLSLVATEKLLFRERGFGVCLGLIGAGAVLGAWFLPHARARFSSESITFFAKAIFAAVLMTIGFSDSEWLIMPALTIVGACWMTNMTTLNATAQINLPRKFRARGMAAFLMSFAAGMTSGSLIWGWLAFYTSLGTSFVVAGFTMLGCTLAVHWLKIGPLVSDGQSP
ncbi:MAG: MFS transporter [Planctomycetales bacterium]|nr:MFS transporter [Planctomycetales bacterium]